MREIRSYGSVGAPEGNLRRYPASTERVHREEGCGGWLAGTIVFLFRGRFLNVFGGIGVGFGHDA
jgi:hypothetical protein